MALQECIEKVWTPSTVIFSIMFAFTTMLLFLYKIKNNSKIKLLDKIPGPVTFPILGNVHEVYCGPREFFIRLDAAVKILKFRDSLMKAWMFHRSFVIISTPRASEIILCSQKHIQKSNDYKFLQPWLGTGLLTSTGKKWHQRRKMLTPAFHFKILEDFVHVFNQQSFKLVSLLQKKADGQPFDMFPFITLCTLDIILETAMGSSIDAQNNSDSDYVKAIYKIGALIQKQQIEPWLQVNLLFKLLGYKKQQENCLQILHGFSYEMIRERKKEYFAIPNSKTCLASDNEDEFVGKKQRRLAFLDLLLEYSVENKLDDEDIREEVDTFMFEGHDTTAAAINWTIYLLGCNPRIQKLLLEELDSLFGDNDRPVTCSDLKEMKFLECCIKEALRLFPSVPFIARQLQEDVILDDFTVPSGTTALIMTYRLHRDPAHFPDPELYMPERFFPENSIGRHPYAYVPFSAGPRNCIGQKFAQMEEKIVLANIFRKYRVESTVRREDLKILGELILRPEDGNVVRLFSRKEK